MAAQVTALDMEEEEVVAVPLDPTEMERLAALGHPLATAAVRVEVLQIAVLLVGMDQSTVGPRVATVAAAVAAVRQMVETQHRERVVVVVVVTAARLLLREGRPLKTQ